MKNGSIVLIDDNKQEIRLFKEALKDVESQHNLIVCHDGAAGFDFITNHAKGIFMIICDINMPLMTGMELLEKINANPDLKMWCIPFIFLSNSASPNEVEHAYSLSAQGYFQKPFALDDLTKIFNSIVTYWSLARIPRDVFI